MAYNILFVLSGMALGRCELDALPDVGTNIVWNFIKDGVRHTYKLRIGDTQLCIEDCLGGDAPLVDVRYQITLQPTRSYAVSLDCLKSVGFSVQSKQPLNYLKPSQPKARKKR